MMKDDREGLLLGWMTTLRYLSMAGWNPLSMEVVIGKSLINGPFSIAMFDYRRVCV